MNFWHKPLASLELPVKKLMPCSLAVLFDSPVGRHCCLWRHITSSDLKKSPSARGPVVFRSDVTMQADLARFQARGSTSPMQKSLTMSSGSLSLKSA